MFEPVFIQLFVRIFCEQITCGLSWLLSTDVGREDRHEADHATMNEEHEPIV